VDVVAIIPAGGSGKRAGGGVPKQFRPIGGQPIFLHTLKKFEASSSVDGVILVVPKRTKARALKIVKNSSLKKVIAVCEGGRERQDSVSAGLKALPPEVKVVVVHDAVRPFVSPGLINKVVAVARKKGAAVAVVPVRDTVKKISKGRVVSTIDRRQVWLVQTPQAFRTRIIRRAHEKASGDGFYGTDDAGLVERLGVPVMVVEGDTGNIKLTEPRDFVLGEAILAHRVLDKGGL